MTTPFPAFENVWSEMEKRIFKVENQPDFERCFPVVKELRPHLTFDDFVSIYEEAKKANGYQLVAAEVQGEIAAVLGYRVLWDFVRGKYIYIDDLVSTKAKRSEGLGRELLEFAEEVARSTGCTSLRLCAVIENERAIHFYERLGWTKRSFAYTKKLTP
ncbi:MAG: GNAT family N-acetyltransferase [Deltaproteobacteria bacterium]|jgi:GNAT superfamily N-acetyltransferase|nr:GNAT family N-acetyltransferase [Deltaproteobacteria bacterium]